MFQVRANWMYQKHGLLMGKVKHSCQSLAKKACLYYLHSTRIYFVYFFWKIFFKINVILKCFENLHTSFPSVIYFHVTLPNQNNLYNFSISHFLYSLNLHGIISGFKRISARCFHSSNSYNLGNITIPLSQASVLSQFDDMQSPSSCWLSLDVSHNGSVEWIMVFSNMEKQFAIKINKTRKYWK